MNSINAKLTPAAQKAADMLRSIETANNIETTNNSEKSSNSHTASNQSYDDLNHKNVGKDELQAQKVQHGVHYELDDLERGDNKLESNLEKKN